MGREYSLYKLLQQPSDVFFLWEPNLTWSNSGEVGQLHKAEVIAAAGAVIRVLALWTDFWANEVVEFN